jgi:aspartyl-tRNA(Asn)/glutamyl-tRNA(Gln) amidotransferase subunit C
MGLTHEEVKHIATLARLGLSDEEIDKFKVQLSDILRNFEILKQIDTSALAPTAQSIELSNVFREDVARPSYSEQDILANAPQQESNFFKVKAVLE